MDGIVEKWNIGQQEASFLLVSSISPSFQLFIDSNKIN